MRTRSNVQGFTLIELIVVIAIVAALPVLLLPAIQKAREAAAQFDASTNLSQLITASQEYRNRMGSYPRRVDDLIGWDLSPLDPEVARGKKNGYLYEIVESDQDHCRVEALPEYAGITGSLTMGAVITRNDVRSYQIISAGADEAKERMLNNIRDKAAETVARLLNLDNSATSQVREVESADTKFGVFNTLDSDDDGRVSVEEILASSSTIEDAELRRPMDQFLAYVAEEMKFDSLSQAEKRTIAVGMADLEQRNWPVLLSYDGLCHLTKRWVNHPDISDSLCSSLESAEAAEARGDVEGKNRSIQKYQKQVRSQIGQAITGSDAKRLNTLAESMVSGY
jgi:prepilin-type N-terminal cleavage/methylation domain-containing protein